MLVLELEQTIHWGRSSHHSPNQNSIVLIHIMGPNLWERQPRKGCDPVQGWIFPLWKLSLLPIPTELFVLALQTMAGCLHSSGVKERGQQGDCGMSSARGLVKSGDRETKGASSSSLSPLLEGELGRGQKQSLCGGHRLGSNSQRLQLGRLRWSRRRTGCPEGWVHLRGGRSIGCSSGSDSPAPCGRWDHQGPVTVLRSLTTSASSWLFAVSPVFLLPFELSLTGRQELLNKMLKCSCLFLFEGRAAKALWNRWQTCMQGSSATWEPTRFWLCQSHHVAELSEQLLWHAGVGQKILRGWLGGLLGSCCI